VVVFASRPPRRHCDGTTITALRFAIDGHGQPCSHFKLPEECDDPGGNIVLITNILRVEGFLFAQALRGNALREAPFDRISQHCS
jgi:hypothetical protein